MINNAKNAGGTVLLLLLTIACSDNSASKGQETAAEAVITFEGVTHTLGVFQCLTDYQAPLDPDEIIAFALEAAPKETPNDLIEAVSGFPDEERINQQAEIITPILDIGPLFSTAHYQNGMDIVVFYPSSSIDEAVFAIDENGFIDFNGKQVSGSVSVEDTEGNVRGELSFRATCPS